MSATHLLERLIDGFLRDTVFGEQARDGILFVLSQGNQQMLGADVVVLQALGFCLCTVQQTSYARCLVNLAGLLV